MKNYIKIITNKDFRKYIVGILGEGEGDVRRLFQTNMSSANQTTCFPPLDKRKSTLKRRERIN